ncbi:MAG: alpha-mannosidase [Anaerolineae bacterium]
MAPKSPALFIVSHIRWEREGKRTFQESRIDLVRIMDSVLELLISQPDFPPLLLDGQTIPLQDYLDVRPGQENLVRDLVRAGRLQVGPWHILPDPLLASPEALLRNLLLGAETALRYGRRLNVGYLPETAGRIGQMPQILRGFDITEAVLLGARTQAAELQWAGPDGSRVLLIGVQAGRGSVTALPGESDSLKAALLEAWQHLSQHTVTGAGLLLTGDGSRALYDDLPALIREVNRRTRKIRILHSGVEHYLEAVRAAPNSFPAVSGPLHPASESTTWGGGLSARMPTKLRNHAVQTLLENWVEPFGAWAALLDGASHRRQSQNALIAYAWRMLLQNHAMPVLTGRCIDQVDREAHARFDQSEQVAHRLNEENLALIAGQINTTALGVDAASIPLAVFNASGQTRSELAAIALDLPPEYSLLEVIDDEGQRVPFDTLHEAEDGPLMTIRFLARDLPPFGYRTYALQPVIADAPETTIDEGTSIENEWLTVTVDREEGTLSLYDSRTGHTFEGLNDFIDGGDAGDIERYVPPPRDTVIGVATNAPLQVFRYVSPVEQILRFLQIYRLPSQLSPDRLSRLPLAAQFIPISIWTTVHLVRGIPRADIFTTVSTSALDHRLQVRFPTGLAAERLAVDGHFAVEQHPGSTPLTDCPQRAFTSVIGARAGLTIASQGLPEVSIAHGENGATIILTLLRSVGWLNGGDSPAEEPGEGRPIAVPGAQCAGDHEFAYSLIPHEADPLPAWQQGWAFQTPVHVRMAGGENGQLPLRASLAEVDNPSFVLSAVKTSADGEGLIVRGYNISEDNQPVTLRTVTPFTTARRVRLDEQPLDDEVSIQPDGRVCFTAGPGQIVSLYLK